MIKPTYTTYKRMITYSELLQQREWLHRCQDILDRDKSRCLNCGAIGFHNEVGYLRLNSIKELDCLFSNWSFKGLAISEFVDCYCEKTYHFETINEIKYETIMGPDKESIQQVRFLELFGKDTKYYSNRFAKRRFIMTCDDGFSLSLVQSIKGYPFFDITTISDTVVNNSWIHILIFEKKISNGMYLNIQGGNYYSSYEYLYSHYELGVTFDNVYIHITVNTNKILFKGLNIHHKYYTQGKKPWEYPDDALVTLCEDCHQKAHETTKIPIYSLQPSQIKYLNTCQRCGGSGYLSRYSHIENGICFKCMGEGICIDDL